MTGQVIFWLILFAVLAVAEIATLQLVSIWFAISAFVSMILAVFGLPLWSQAAAFALVALLLLIATRPALKRIMYKRMVPTNAELDVGKLARVIEPIDKEKSTGRVELNGVFWSAWSDDANAIPVNATVRVENISGTRLKVSRVLETADSESQYSDISVKSK